MSRVLAFVVAAISLTGIAAEIRGPFPILSAPYEEDGALDLETLVKEARFVADAGVGGFIWCQSNDAVDLLTPEEKKASFAALAKAFEGEDVYVTLGCQGRNTADMEELASEVERLAAAHPAAKLLIACRPPLDARTQADIGAYYRRLAAIAKRPVIVQTYASDKVPSPSPELLIRLAKEFPGVYGWIKEETGGEDANERMRRECAAPEIKTVFSAWGSYGWIDQYRNYGTRGLISERAAYADYLMAVWTALEEGNAERVDDLWAKYLLMMNLSATIPGGHLRGFNLYVLKKRGIFKNFVSRDYADKDKTPGRWKLENRVFTPAEVAEIEARWKRMSEMIPSRTFVSRIPLLKGERWFGGAVNLGRYQPWTEASDTRDIDYGDSDYDLGYGCWGGGVMPFLVSDQGRYVWSDGPFRFRFAKGVLRIESNVGKVRPVRAGKTLKDAYLAGARAHFPFDGRMPPKEFFEKPQFNNWIEIFLQGVNQDVSEKYVKDLAASGFPCGVFMTDGGWMKYHGAEKFDEEKFPDPIRYFDLIRGQGWKSLLWMSPFVSPDSQREYRQLRYYPYEGLPGSGYHKGLDYLVHEKNGGRAAILRWWSGNSAAYDLTNPAAFEYYVRRLQKFAADYHFDGFKFDAGNPDFLPADDYRLFRPGMPRCEYGRAYTMVGTRIPYNEFRSGFGTGGKPIVQRLHDQPHAWAAQPEIIRDMIAAGLVGYPYAVADMIGGGACGSFFPDKPFYPDLVVRSCQLQALMPMMQFSLAPWRVLDERMCGICRDYAKLHCEFAPYILKWAEHASKTGEPILRSMDYEFPGQGFGDCFTQFMLGPDWLVAPVITSESRVTVRLPRGTWKDDLGEVHVGPKTLELEDVPLERLPRFHREVAPTDLAGRPDFLVYRPTQTADAYNDHFQVIWDEVRRLYYAFWTQATREGAPDMRVVFSKSSDGGRTWTAPMTLAGTPIGEPPRPRGVWQQPMLAKGGRLYCLWNQQASAEALHHGLVYGRYSDDAGETWSVPEENVSIPRQPMDDSKGVQLPNWCNWQRPVRVGAGGRFMTGCTRHVKPVDVETSPGRPVGSWVEFWQYENIDENPEVRDIRITVLNGGEKSLSIPIPGTDRFCCEEASLVKLPDGRLFTLVRSRARHPFWSASADGGRTWTAPKPLKDKTGRAFLHPNSPCPMYDLMGCAAASGTCFALVHDAYDDSIPPLGRQVRGPLYFLRGTFDSAGEQPIVFEKESVFLPLETDNSCYSSYTVADGKGIIWFGLRKHELVGKRVK